MHRELTHPSTLPSALTMTNWLILTTVEQCIHHATFITINKRLHSLVVTYPIHDGIKAIIIPQKTLALSTQLQTRNKVNMCKKFSQGCTTYTHNQFGERNFTAASPRLWKDLQSRLQQPDLKFPVFKQKLKMHLFGLGYS